jgi:hypothetical protein
MLDAFALPLEAVVLARPAPLLALVFRAVLLDELGVTVDHCPEAVVAKQLDHLGALPRRRPRPVHVDFYLDLISPFQSIGRWRRVATDVVEVRLLVGHGRLAPCLPTTIIHQRSCGRSLAIATGIALAIIVVLVVVLDVLLLVVVILVAIIVGNLLLLLSLRPLRPLLARLTDATVPPRVEEPRLAALARAGALAPRLCRWIGILIAAE